MFYLHAREKEPYNLEELDLHKPNVANNRIIENKPWPNEQKLDLLEQKTIRKDEIYAKFCLLHSEVSISYWDYYVSEKVQIF